MTALTSSALIGTIAACCSTLAFLPQLVKVRRQGGADVSAAMLAMYLVGLGLWLAYGVINRAGAIIGALGRLVVPGKQNIPIWLTMVVGVVAALLGTVIARAIGVSNTKGVDWIELLFQVVLAAIGVALVAGMASRRRLTR